MGCDFVTVRTTTGGQVESAITLKVLKNQSGENLIGDLEQSKKILKDHGMRLLTKEEALVWLAQHPEEKEKLKEKWFYLDGKGITENGLYSFNEKGELIGLTGKETVEQKVCVWSGKNPLHLSVYSDVGAAYYDWRFCLLASRSPQGVASAVVGVEIGKEAAGPRKATDGMVEIPEKE